MFFLKFQQNYCGNILAPINSLLPLDFKQKSPRTCWIFVTL